MAKMIRYHGACQSGSATFEPGLGWAKKLDQGQRWPPQTRPQNETTAEMKNRSNEEGKRGEGRGPNACTTEKCTLLPTQTFVQSVKRRRS